MAPNIDVESLKPFLLLGGYNAADLWPTTNLTMPGFLLLAIAPRWKYTPVCALIGPITCAIFVLDDGSGDDPDFMSLEGVVEMFRDPNAVFIGWLHFIAYDAFIARWIVLDSVRLGASLKVHYLLVVPCLFFALMLGPIGFVLYISIVRTLVLGAGVDIGSKEKSD